MKPMFTPEELEEMRRADEEIEASFVLSNEEVKKARERDRRHRFANLDTKGQVYAETQRRYYEANREKVAETQRRYREANREKVAETKRRYREANREKVAETQRRYREANREKVAETQRRYYEANREKVAETQRRYYEDNREKVAETKRQALRDFRKEHGLSQKEFGDALGVTQGAVSQWETGIVPFDEERIREIFPLFKLQKGN